MTTSNIPSSKETLPFEEFDFSAIEEDASIYATIKISPSQQDEPLPLDDRSVSEEPPLLQILAQPETIAEGQTWRIYLGQQQLPYRQIAIKKLKPEKKYLARELLEEALIIGRLNHPNVPPIYQVQFDEAKQPEVIMKKIEGISFHELLANKAQTNSDLHRSLSILFQVCHAIEFAHSKGYLHRDLKAKNIMVGEFNQVYVMDWGLSINFNSPLRKSKRLVGSPAYMATEMLSGDPNILTPATDVFLLGAILHEILTGEYRNQGSTVRETLIAASKAQPYQYSEDTPEVLSSLCNWACSKDPADRPQTVLIFRQHLEDIIVNWEAVNLLQKGISWLDEYKLRWAVEQEKDLVDDLALYQIALQAKFAFEQALEIWPNLAQAKENLIETIELIIQQSLEAREYQRALLLYEESSIYLSRKKNIQKLFEEVLRMWEIDKQRDSSLSNVKRQRDPSLSHQSRSGLAIILAIIIVVGIIQVIAWRFLKLTITVEENFYFTLSALIPLWIGLGILYKRLQINDFSQQVLRTLMFNTVTIVLAGYGCWVFETEVSFVFMLYSLISSLVWVNSAPVIKKGKLLGTVGFLVTLVSIFMPHLSQILFLILVSSAGMVIANDWKKHPSIL